jgi:phage-related baseplate assembly protein
MSTTSAIDLSQLPKPTLDVVLDYEVVLAAHKAKAIEVEPDLDTSDEADPAVAVLEVGAYRETLTRQDMKETALAQLLAYATGNQIDQIGARLNVLRLTDEDDAAYKLRIQLAPTSYSVAGPGAAYRYFALSAASTIADVSVTSPNPGVVLITVLSKNGDGTASDTELDAVRAATALDANVRPLTDNVIVQSAQIIPYAIEEQLTLFDGPDGSVVQAASLASVTAYAAAARKLGRDINPANIYAATGGVSNGISNIDLISPPAPIVISDTQASYCTAISITVAGRGE